MSDKEELYRRLEQVRRLTSAANDDLTRQRLSALVADIEQQLADAEANDADAPRHRSG